MKALPLSIHDLNVLVEISLSPMGVKAAQRLVMRTICDIDGRKHSHNGGRYSFMMRLVKRLAGIQDGGTATSSSFITGSSAINAGSSKKGQIVSNMIVNSE